MRAIFAQSWWIGLLAALNLVSAAAPARSLRFTVMSFNIQEGGADAMLVGFTNSTFGGSRHDDIANVIRECDADIVGVQEGGAVGPLLKELGPDWHGLATGNSKFTSAVVSKFPLEALTVSDFLLVARVKVPGAQPVVLVNTHWSPRTGGGVGAIQQRLRAGDVPTDLGKFESEILALSDAGDGPRGYRLTLDTLRPHLRAGENVILTGDFNESSHLDWTARAAATGQDRWVKNPTGRPLRFKMEWQGSKLLADAGLHDAYRTVFPDEVAKPGITWTPPYPNGTPGRRPPGDQVLERIDMIYFSGPDLKVTSAGVVGETKETCEFVHPGPWPSDHRAIKATFDLSPSK